jgi:hypothetical protein
MQYVLTTLLGPHSRTLIAYETAKDVEALSGVNFIGRSTVLNELRLLDYKCTLMSNTDRLVYVAHIHKQFEMHVYSVERQ